MLFARTVLAVGAQGFVAGVFALQGSATPWQGCEPWLPVYGTLIDASFMTFRLLAPLPFSVFQALVYLRLRRLLPLAIGHALMDGATVLIPH